MAKSAPKSPPKSSQRFPQRTPQRDERPEPIDPVWLLKAIGLTVVAAAVCAYITFCLLFCQGQWQLVLHPARGSGAPGSIDGAPYELIHFGPDESATPQLTGWWIPAPPNGRYADTTLLFLPGASGSLADSIPALATLHSLGINIFAFDYRGYGQSAATHPNQQRMTHDAEAAWLYLTGSRHISASRIVPYGAGVGASLAVYLAAAHVEIPAVILDSPTGDLISMARNDPRSKLLPLGLLFHENFPLAAPLSTLRTPKLLINYAPGNTPAIFHTALDPKLTVELPSHAERLYSQSVTRFLDQYIRP